ncbi:hypothetical protein VF21_08829 [Pseudogymnoascus sp. 05NY08]|nr:hypothetical protein VF21_08829 [Pseudogymnoascus sp. 05NY08]
MSEQLLQATSFIHGAGLAHGDMSSRNIAFTCSNLSYCADEESVLKCVGPPEIDEVTRIDGAPLRQGLPTQMVKAAEWMEWVDEDEEDIRLLDFGETFTQGAEPERIAQPGVLRAPETIFTHKFDYRLDLWRVGIAIYSFVFRGLPLHHMFGDVNDLVAQMINFVEDLPAEWQEKYRDMRLKAGREPLEEEDVHTPIQRVRENSS